MALKRFKFFSLIALYSKKYYDPNLSFDDKIIHNTFSLNLQAARTLLRQKFCFYIFCGGCVTLGALSRDNCRYCRIQSLNNCHTFRDNSAQGFAETLSQTGVSCSYVLYVIMAKYVPFRGHFYHSLKKTMWLQRWGIALGQSPNAKNCVGNTNMLVSKNAKICVTSNAKPKICVTPNANPQCKSVEYRL